MQIIFVLLWLHRRLLQVAQQQAVSVDAAASTKKMDACLSEFGKAVSATNALTFAIAIIVKQVVGCLYRNAFR